MATYKVPARIWFVEEFPVTVSANGTKIQRGVLREMARTRLAAQGAARS
jgi:fatty-acyl-CoA synthase